MRYGFILGRVFTLSLAELFAVLERPEEAAGTAGNKIAVLESSPEAVIVETEKPLRAEYLQRRLGGIVKIVQIIDAVPKREQDSINFALRHYFKPSTLKKQFLKEYKGKIQFGVSIYLLDMGLGRPPLKQAPGGKDRPAPSAFGEPKRIGMGIKNTLTDGGASVRLVLPEFNGLALASVVVTKNLLLSKGCEVCLFAGKTVVYTGKTLVVQDFEDYGRRDYQRPVRDEKTGMIPPKVAQIMLNLSGAKVGETVLDPFCGIGTIIQEGLLLGFKMLGSDLKQQAIAGSETNLEWFRNRYKIAPGKYHLEVSDAADVAKLLTGQKVAHVVTECTLGPIYGSYPKPKEIEQNFEDLAKLYQKILPEFAKFLSPGGRVVLCIPAYRRNRDEYEMFPSLDFARDLGYHLVATVSPTVSGKFGFLKLTERGTVIYDRKDQIVAREIVIFEKQ